MRKKSGKNSQALAELESEKQDKKGETDKKLISPDPYWQAEEKRRKKMYNSDDLLKVLKRFEGKIVKISRNEEIGEWDDSDGYVDVYYHGIEIPCPFEKEKDTCPFGSCNQFFSNVLNEKLEFFVGCDRIEWFPDVTWLVAEQIRRIFRILHPLSVKGRDKNFPSIENIEYPDC